METPMELPKVPKTQKKKLVSGSVKEHLPIKTILMGFVLGIIVEGIVIFFMAKPLYLKMLWATQHPEEMKWAMDRYDTIQKASKVLYFDNTFGTK